MMIMKEEEESMMTTMTSCRLPFICLLRTIDWYSVDPFSNVSFRVLIDIIQIALFPHPIHFYFIGLYCFFSPFMDEPSFVTAYSIS